MTKQEYSTSGKASRLKERLGGLSYPVLTVQNAGNGSPAIVSIDHISGESVNVKVHIGGGFTVAQGGIVRGVTSDRYGLFNILALI